MANVGRPEAGEYAPYFERYVSLVPGEDPLAVLEEQAVAVRRTLQGLPEAGAGFRYAPEKWSVCEVVGHCADAERVFAYRALAFARGEKAALPPFDENEFARLAGHDGVPFAELLDEFAAVRAATLASCARSTACRRARRSNEASRSRQSGPCQMGSPRVRRSIGSPAGGLDMPRGYD